MKHSSSKRIHDARTESVTTTERVTASPASGADAEFCDSKAATLRFGLKRGALYELYGLGLIRGVALRKRGALRGRRLWSVDSIRQYICCEMEAQEK
jgi:hypothetical protein